MNEVIKTYKQRNERVEILQDTRNTLNPYQEWEMLGEFIEFCKSYQIGEDIGEKTRQQVILEKAKEVMTPKEREEFHEEYGYNLWKWARYNNMETVSEHVEEKLWDKIHEEYFTYPVYAYIHSGISLSLSSFHSKWDSGQVGWWFVSEEDVRSWFNRERITNKLRGRIKSVVKEQVGVLDAWVSGEVFYFKKYENEELVDSCGGFFGCDFETNGLKEHAGISEWD